MSTFSLPRRKRSPKNLLASLDQTEPYIIPINDLDAYEQNPEHNWIYNRLELAKWQKFPAFSLPLLPEYDEYPVILKPIINLYGFSLDCHKFSSEKELLRYLEEGKSTLFWTTYHTSSHTLSTDLLVDKGKILMSYTMRGRLNQKTEKKAKKPGLYDYWEFVPHYPTPSIIRKFVRRKLQRYRGVLNVETINNHIIEAHLRLGNVFDLLESKQIIKHILQFYFSSGPSSKLPNPRKVYLIPVFIPHEEEFTLTSKQIKKLLTTSPRLTSSSSIRYYEIDDPKTSHPEGYRRVVQLTTTNLSDGRKARRLILRAHQDSILYQKYNLDFAEYPMTAQPILAPALPVRKLSSSPPRPKSSSPS